jgi:hypothetical protein
MFYSGNCKIRMTLFFLSNVVCNFLLIWYLTVSRVGNGGNIGINMKLKLSRCSKHLFHRPGGRLYQFLSQEELLLLVKKKFKITFFFFASTKAQWLYFQKMIRCSSSKLD